ncbi:MAG: menaquinone biosynthesis protein [Chitinophagaceae bacterium]|nr:menaquinone biosynthesis protein [Chitinophagaceae bacterium]
MQRKIRLGVINYLNVKPLLYGIQHSPVINDIEIVETYPARLAQMLVEDEVDAGIVPVAIIPYLKEHHIVSDYCIGCDGPVATVCLFSEVPIERIQKVLLDYHSRTSVMLAKILLKRYWKIEPEFEDAKGEEYRHRITGTTAGLVIGDRAFEQRRQSTYIYDLGEAWKDYTGLGFVFAAWIANKALPETFVTAFNNANALGLQHIDEVVAQTAYKLFDLNQYYKHNINYVMDERKKAGLEEFLFQLKQIRLPQILNV